MLLNLIAAAVGRGTGTKLTLSGATVTVSGSSSPQTTALRISDNGKVERKINTGAWEQVPGTTTDWIVPNSAAPSDYEARWTGATGDTANLSATVAEDTWSAIGSQMVQVTLTDTDNGPPAKTAQFTFEIRKASGSVLVSNTYNLSSDFDNL